MEWLQTWLEWMQTHGIALQVDPLAFAVATLSLVYAWRANRRAESLESAERARAGQIQRVEIQKHSMQNALDFRRKHTTALRDTRHAEGFVCSAYSGDYPAIVEGVYLKIVYIEGLLAQRRYEIHVDLDAGEGLAEPAPQLPHRLGKHDRLDWTFPTFLVTSAAKRGLERKAGSMRIHKESEQLKFEFGAYSAVNGTPVVDTRWHREHLFVVPIPWKAPWSIVTKYDSLWSAVTAPECPETLKAWFLEWVECRADFKDHMEGSGGEDLRAAFFDIVLRREWPSGWVLLRPGVASVGSRDFNTPRVRLLRTLLAVGDLSPVDEGRVLSGPGGSSYASRFRIYCVLVLLSGRATAEDLPPNPSDWPHGVTRDDSHIRAAIDARRLIDRRAKAGITKAELKRLDQLASMIKDEIVRCTYMPIDMADTLMARAVAGDLPESGSIK